MTELECWKKWAVGGYPWMGDYKQHAHKLFRAQETENHYAAEGRDLTLKEFCQGDKQAFDRITNGLDGPVIELGPGMSGQTMFWFWRAKPCVQIDPLWREYLDLASEWEARIGLESWLKKLTWRCELEPTDAGKYAVVVCRNMLDHTHDADKLIHQILNLGKVGAYLLFWSELWHAPDEEGHFNTNLTANRMEELLVSYGWKKLRPVEAIHGPGYNEKHHFGCVALRERLAI